MAKIPLPPRNLFGEQQRPIQRKPEIEEIRKILRSDPVLAKKVLPKMEPKVESRENRQIPKAVSSGGRKVTITIRLDPEIIEFFEKDGKGWQTRLNDFLLSEVGKRK